MYNRIISTLTTTRNNITAIMSVWKQKFTVPSVMSHRGCFSFYCSFSRFLNNEACNLFKNIRNYIFENLPVPVKHFCDPGVAK